MTSADIVARLEKAVGPDRDLDVEIGELVGAADHSGPAGHRPFRDWARHYTASIDAALTLIPEHCYVIELRELGPTRWFARIGEKADDAKSWESEGRYGNLALAAAALQARDARAK